MNIPFVEKASRLEIIFRILYLIIYMVIGMIFGALVAYILVPIQFLAILILGKRVSVLHNLINSYAKYTIQYLVYLFMLTDERPPIMPSF